MTAKNKNLLKASAVSALALLLFSIGFIVFSNGTLSARIDSAEVPPNGTQANDALETSSDSEESEIIFAEEVLGTRFTIPAELLRTDDFTKPQLDIVELRAARGTRGVEFDELWAISDDERNPEALSAEEAALLGAEYIWDMSRANIDGKTVEMQYGQWNGYAGSLWEGKVMIPEEERVDGDMWFSYSFLLDAVTGERVEMSNWARPCQEQDISPETLAYLESIRESDPVVHDNLWNDAFALSVRAPETQELIEQTGRFFAEKHFNNSEVIDIHQGGKGSTLERNEAGEIVVALTYFSVIAVDNNGRAASLHFEISKESEVTLIHIMPTFPPDPTLG